MELALSLIGEISIHSSDQVKGVFVVDLPGKSDAQCELQFCPQTVCCQDKYPVCYNIIIMVPVGSFI